MKFSNAFRAFRSRNYSLFFSGQLISRIGMWMQRTAVIWVVYTMTNSVLMVGIATFAEQFPSFILSPAGGITADRYDRYKILMVTQVTSALQAVLLTVLYYSGYHEIWMLLTLSVILGIANAYDIPARQAMVNDLVKSKDDLPAAIAMNSSLNNFSRLAGPALAGIILAKYGAAICFGLNAVSFIAVIVCLNLIKFPVYQEPQHRKNPWTDFKEGLAYTRGETEIRNILILCGLVSLLVITYNTLQPYFAREVFHGDAATYGYINAATGFGAFISTLVVASQKKGSRLKMLLFYNLLLLGVGLIVMSFVKVLPVFLLVCFVCGFGTMSVMPICNTIIQTVSTEHMRGRVVGFFAMATLGTLPLGSLFIGWVSKMVEARYCQLAQGFICLVIVTAFYKFLKRDATVANVSYVQTTETTQQEVVQTTV
ncbi:MAG: MFS transporter [Agriterribacter sp.]